MSSLLNAAQRRRTRLLAFTSIASICSFAAPSAHAQQTVTAEALPAILVSPLDENRTRARPVDDQQTTARRVVPNVSRVRKRKPVGVTTAAVAATTTAPAERQFNGIVGASATVITADDIARSPAGTLQEIIAQSPGVQLTSLYGGVNGAGTTVDLRGFGAVASANTLILINGRRLNDVDLAGVDLSTIPRDSIERIEITRGNSGAVLYGDNAVGGVINIVTKTAVGGPPVAMRFEGGVGSFNQRMGQVSVAANAGPWSSTFFGNMITSDGYRANNRLDQRNAVGEIRYTTPDLTAFVNLSGDDQRLRLPGPRVVDPSAGVNELLTNRRGTSTPFDYADRQGANATAGFTKSIWNGVDLIVDGGVRDKKQQAAFFGSSQAIPFNYVDTDLLTWSITPRLRIKSLMFGLPSTILTGVDYNDADYHSDRPQFKGAAPIHVYDLTQQSVAAYWQQTVGLLPTTDFSYGGRIQRNSLSARDKVDPNAPGNFGDAQAMPLDTAETQHALHVGLEHRFNSVFSVFGRAASAFRTPNVDERVSSGPAFDPVTFASIPGDFRLKTQTSNDVEGGFRIAAGAFQMQSSLYNMNLNNELQFDPVNFFNRNLDPTRRYGSETSATFRATDTLLFRGGVAYTRAVFREGSFAGNDVPLVSRLTANGGVSWNIWQKYLVFDATARFWSSRRMDNDQANTQKVIPANATVDLKLGGEIDRYFWSLSVNNVFDVQYYDYAVASTFTPDRFAAYPLPGRTYMLKAGATF